MGSSNFVNLWGAKVEGFYLTIGRYDLVVIVDAPDHETISKIILATSSKGAVSTKTLPALADEIRAFCG